MSDEALPSLTITVERRRVERRKMLTDKGDGSYADLYVVTERQGATWLPISKGYAHSTSAYAKLGRITSNQSQKGDK